MSLKIHVMYQGIIYRVRGIKVLCSVVSAVIILLIAIVSMGIWMLVTAYGTDRPSVPKKIEQRVVKTPSSIAYQVPPDPPEDMVLDPNSEIGRNQPLIPPTTEKSFVVMVESPSVPGATNEDIFTSKMFNSNVQERPRLPRRRKTPNIHVPASDLITASSSNAKVTDSDDIEEMVRASFPIFGLKELGPETALQEESSVSKKLMEHPQFEYIHQENKDHPSYDGPPVVGYGRNPYTKLSPARLKEYENLWKSYMDRKGTLLRENLQPNLRKLDKPETGKIPRRRQRPPIASIGYHKTLDVEDRLPSPGIRGLPPPRKFLPDTKMRPPAQNPNRRLETFSEEIHFEEDEKGGIFGPFQDLYKYSTRLASSLLNFSSRENEPENDSSEMFIKDGLHLIEDYNEIFQNSSNPLSSITPSRETLRSLNPFEMSLVTWTFLDYWEFLIEKVGTLSKEDLQLLRQRLDKARKKKDGEMTRSLVNQTITHISHEKVGPGEVVDTPGTARSLMEGRSFISPKAVRQFLQGLFPSVFSSKNVRTTTVAPEPVESTESPIAEARMWDPLGFFSSEARQQFMQYAVKILFNFGKVYLRKPYAVDCTMLLFCKDINRNANTPGIDGISAKLKSVGLKVLIEKEVRETDTFADVFRAVTSWQPLHCDAMFPRCDGTRALEIVNEVAVGSE